MKEEPEEDSKMICVSVQDEFVLKQDMCAMCGAIGTDLEGRLIACAQCGECYHPHCINVRVTKVILQKGTIYLTLKVLREIDSISFTLQVGVVSIAPFVKAAASNTMRPILSSATNVTFRTTFTACHPH